MGSTTARSDPAPPVGRPGTTPSSRGASIPVPARWTRWISSVGVLGIALGIFVVLGLRGTFDLRFVLAHLPEGVGPALVSLELTTLAFAIGFVLAMPLGLVRAYGPGAGPKSSGGGWPASVQWVAIFGATELAILGLFAFGLLGLYPVGPIEGYLGRGADPLGTLLELTVVAAAVGAAAVFLLRQRRAGRPALRARSAQTGGPRGDATPVPPSAQRSNASMGAGAVGSVLRWPFYGFATGYVAAIRGTPFLVQVFVVYYAFIFAYPRFQFLGVPVPFWAGLIALAINTTAYQAEALRGGFQSVEHSQIEAAKALGFRAGQIFFRVTLPQSLRLVTLPLSNEWISTFKTSTILSYITVIELYFWARSDIAYQLNRPLEAFVIVALFYLVINVTLSRSVSYVEKRYRIPGLGSMAPELPGRRGLLADRS